MFWVKDIKPTSRMAQEGRELGVSGKQARREGKGIVLETVAQGAAPHPAGTGYVALMAVNGGMVMSSVRMLSPATLPARHGSVRYTQPSFHPQTNPIVCQNVLHGSEMALLSAISLSPRMVPGRC